MNVKKSLIVAALSAFAAAGAFAQEVSADDLAFPAKTTSGKTRDEVKAELAAAREQGNLPVFSGELSVFPSERTTGVARSREDVRKETISYLRQNRFSAADETNFGG